MTKRPLPYVALIVVAVCLGPVTVHAHSLAVYLATPITPPKGYEWIQVAYLLLVTLAIATFRARHLPAPWFQTVPAVLLAVSICSGAFAWLGVVAAGANTGPSPGLSGTPYPIFVGQKALALAWPDFIQWNLAGIGFLALAAVVSLRSTTGKARWAALAFLLLAAHPIVVIVGAPGLTAVALAAIGLVWERQCAGPVVAAASIYVLALAPVVFTRSIAYGWAGSYVTSDCELAVYRLTKAAIRYANAHDGILPAATSSADALAAIRPFDVDTRAFRWTDSPLACPLAYIFEGREDGLRWNTTVAGARLSDLLGEREPPALFSCDYASRRAHGHFRHDLIALSDLAKRVAGETRRPLPSANQLPPLGDPSWFSLRPSQSATSTGYSTH